MNAIYRCVDKEGQCYEFRADTEDNCGKLMELAGMCFPEVEMEDIIREERAGTTDEDDFPESEYLKLGQESAKIDLVIERRNNRLTAKGLEKLFEKARERTEAMELPLQEVPEDVPVVEPPEEPSEPSEPEETIRETIRPLLVVKVIEAKEESKDLSCLFG